MRVASMERVGDDGYLTMHSDPGTYFFITQLDGHECRVSTSMNLAAISGDTAEAIAGGDVAVLEEHVQPVPDEQGTFRLVGCAGSLNLSEDYHAIAGAFDDNIVRELGPAALKEFGVYVG